MTSLRSGLVVALFLSGGGACGEKPEESPAAASQALAVAPVCDPTAPGLGAFAVYAESSVVLGQGAYVSSGAVGVRTSAGPFLHQGFALALLPHAQIAAAYASSVLLDRGASAGPLFTGRLVDRGGTHGAVAALPALPAIPGLAAVHVGTQALSVPAGAVREIGPGGRKSIVVGKGATLRLQGGVYELGELEVRQRGRLEALGPVVLRMSGELEAMTDSFIGPAAGRPLSAKDLRFEVKVPDEHCESAVRFSEGASVRALVLAPTGTVRFLPHGRATGAFVARKIDLGSDVRLVHEDGFASGPSCGDGNACNGAETCRSGVCTAGTPPPPPIVASACNEAVCDPAVGWQLRRRPAGTSCSDGDACNGAEICDPLGVCLAGVAPSLDDGSPCTVDACDHLTGATHAPVAPGTPCLDGNPCNGAEACVAAGMCALGTPLVTDDGNPCTVDFCDPLRGAVHQAVADGGHTTCGIGACRRTIDNCAAGIAQTCIPGAPSTEACGNAVDEDCDGQIDDPDVCATPPKQDAGVDAPSDETGVDAGPGHEIDAPVNQPPVAVDDTYAARVNEPLSIAAPGALSNDHDPESDPLTASLLTRPTNGSVVLNANGSFTYTPDTFGRGEPVLAENVNLVARIPGVQASASTNPALAAALIDGQLGTFWPANPAILCNGSTLDSFVEVSFPQDVTVSELRLIANRSHNFAQVRTGTFHLFGASAAELFSTDIAVPPSDNPTTPTDASVTIPHVPGVRRVRLTIVQDTLGSPGCYPGIAEIQVMGSTLLLRDAVADHNLTQLMPTVARTSSPLEIFPPEAAIDDMDSDWISGSNDPGNFLELEFPVDVTVDALEAVTAKPFNGYGTHPNPIDCTSKFELFRGDGSVAFDSGLVNLPNQHPIVVPDPFQTSRELPFTVSVPHAAGIRRVRFTISGCNGAIDEGIFGHQVGFSELRVLGTAALATPGFSVFTKLLAAEGRSAHSTSLVANLTDDNADGRIDEHDVPDIAVVVEHSSNDQFHGEIKVMSGDDGRALFTAGGPDLIDPASELAVGDIDGDGAPEIIAVSGGNGNASHLTAFSNTGALKWISDASDPRLIGGAIAIANLDGVGRPEIVVGATVFDAQGKLLGDGRTLGGSNGGDNGGLLSTGGMLSSISVVADIDLDGVPEIVAGPTAYRLVDGVLSKVWQRTDRLDGYAAVGNFDDDPFAEIVVVARGKVYMLNHDGSDAEVWNPPTHAPVPLRGGDDQHVFTRGLGGAPTVADLDGDGIPEIGVAGASHFTVFNRDGSVKWASVISDYSSHSTGSTVFDFDGDGSAEIVYRDEGFLRIYRGADGAVLAKIPVSSRTFTEEPVVADVDNDGHAEILVTADTGFGGTGAAGVFVLEDIADKWVRTRRIWNQHSYHVTNVNENGTIPLVEKPQWLLPGLNAFRTNAFIPGESQDSADGFTYKVNDGKLDSNVATVRITTHPPHSAPQITSAPLKNAAVGLRYLYAPKVVDPDLGDVFTFSLPTAPTGMTISAFGLVEWTPTSDQLGNHDVVIKVRDAHGLFALQGYNVQVRSPVTVPDVVGQPRAAAEAAILSAGLTVGTVSTQNSATVPPGSVISLNPASGKTAAPGSPVGIVVSSGTPANVDTDGDGFTPSQRDCNDADPAIHPGAADVPGDGVDQDCNGEDADPGAVDEVPPVALIELSSAAIPLGGAVTVTVRTHDNTAIGMVTLKIDGTLVLVSNRGNGVFQTEIVGTVTGTHFLDALVLDAAGNRFSDSARFLVFDPSLQGLLAATIDSPVDDQTISQPVEIVGTASGDGFLDYRLEYAARGTDSFVEFARGNVPVTAGVLGTLDPTRLTEGAYEIRLTARNLGGQEHSAAVVLETRSRSAVGIYTLSFQDKVLPLGGLPLKVTRNYDNRDKTKGDFGIGWKVGLNAAYLVENRVPGANWEQAKVGGIFGTFTILATKMHKATVYFGEGDHERLDFIGQPNPSQQRFLPIELPGSMDYVAIGLTQGSLTPIEQPALMSTVPGPFEYLDFDFNLYHPSGYVYTSPDGFVFTFKRQTSEGLRHSLRRMVDPTGNAIDITSEGVVRSDGKSIGFVRDTAGRIIRIQDPNGRQITYEYDIRGDLVAVADEEGVRSEFSYDNNHNLLEIRGPGGRVVRNEFDGAGRLIAAIDALGNRTEIDHDIEGRHEVVRDRNGNVSIVSYDERGNVLSRRDALGNSTTFTYDASGNKLTETDPLGNVRSLSYDERGNVLSQTDPLGNTTSFVYDSHNQIVEATNAMGGKVALTYDSARNVIETLDPLRRRTTATYEPDGSLLTLTGPLGKLVTNVHDAAGSIVQQTDGLGHTSSFTYDANGNQTSQNYSFTDESGARVTASFGYSVDARGRLTRFADPAGRAGHVEYDGMGKIAAMTDHEGRTTRYEYDAMGNAIRIRDAEGRAESSTFDANGNCVTTTDRLGSTTRFEYDALNRVTRVVFSDGHTLQNVFDAAGRMVARIDSNGHRTSYEFDRAGRVIKLTDALGNSWSSSYDGAGRLVRVTDPEGNATEHEYDLAGQRTRTVYADGTFAAMAYDTMGRLVARTDPDGRITHYEFDIMGHLTRVVDAKGGQTTFAYDERGAVLSQTDANGHVTRWTYDKLRRITGQTLPLGMHQSLSYNENGHVSARTAFDGKTTSFAYSDNRVARKTYHDDSMVQLAHAADGRRTEMTDATGTTLYRYDSRRRLLDVSHSDGNVIRYAYDAAGNPVSLTGPSGTAKYTYDAANRLESVKDPDGGLTRYVHDRAGNIIDVSLPNGLRTVYEHDRLNRVTRIAHLASDGSEISGLRYTFSPAGDRLSMIESSGRAVNYSYDNLHRVIAETVADPSVGTATVAYTYDAAGNRLSRRGPGGATSYTYDANDRLLAADAVAYGYDPNGNLIEKVSGGAITAYRYDGAGKLASILGGVGEINYRYDGDGARVAASVEGVETRFLQDKRGALPMVLEERNGSGALLASYVRGHGLLSQQRGGHRSYYLRDALGTTRALADPEGRITDTYAYDAFGNLASSTGSTPNIFLFTGEEFDADAELYFQRARYYDPSTGRFAASDRFPAKSIEPGSVHRYAYCANNPVNWVDPSGQSYEMGSLALGIASAGIFASLAVQAYTTWAVYTTLDPLSFTSTPDATLFGANISVAPTAVLENSGLAANPIGATAALAFLNVSGVGGLDLLFPSRFGDRVWIYGFVGPSLGLSSPIPATSEGAASTFAFGNVNAYTGQVWNVKDKTAYEGWFMSVSASKLFGKFAVLQSLVGGAAGVSFFTAPNNHGDRSYGFSGGASTLGASTSVSAAWTWYTPAVEVIDTGGLPDVNLPTLSYLKALPNPFVDLGHEVWTQIMSSQ